MSMIPQVSRKRVVRVIVLFEEAERRDWDYVDVPVPIGLKPEELIINSLHNNPLCKDYCGWFIDYDPDPVSQKMEIGLGESAIIGLIHPERRGYIKASSSCESIKVGIYYPGDESPIEGAEVYWTAMIDYPEEEE